MLVRVFYGLNRVDHNITQRPHCIDMEDVQSEDGRGLLKIESPVDVVTLNIMHSLFAGSIVQYI